MGPTAVIKSVGWRRHVPSDRLGEPIEERPATRIAQIIPVRAEVTEFGRGCQVVRRQEMHQLASRTDHVAALHRLRFAGT